MKTAKTRRKLISLVAANAVGRASYEPHYCSHHFASIWGRPDAIRDPLRHDHFAYNLHLLPAHSAYFHITILNLINITFDAMVLVSPLLNPASDPRIGYRTGGPAFIS